jgi:lipoprotein-anchoring transpeptidase ErfK/SrfK
MIGRILSGGNMRPFAAAGIIGALGLVVIIGAPARAEVLIRIDKADQRMTVVVDGFQRFSWPVSTGLGGGPPSGSYRPERLERDWYSRKYGWSPMPHSIFFHGGYAIHGTIYVSRLGKRASHGCVRLHPDNAAILFGIVKREGVANTRIVVESGASGRLEGPRGGRRVAALRLSVSRETIPIRRPHSRR